MSDGRISNEECNRRLEIICRLLEDVETPVVLNIMGMVFKRRLLDFFFISEYNLGRDCRGEPDWRTYWRWSDNIKSTHNSRVRAFVDKIFEPR